MFYNFLTANLTLADGSFGQIKIVWAAEALILQANNLTYAHLFVKPYKIINIRFIKETNLYDQSK